MGNYENTSKIPSGSQERFQLTKRVFMSLPEGLYIVSNCCQTLGKRGVSSIYEGYIGPLSTREQQWSEIREASANHRLCHVFESRKKYIDSLGEVGNGRAMVLLVIQGGKA